MVVAAAVEVILVVDLIGGRWNESSRVCWYDSTWKAVAPIEKVL